MIENFWPNIEVFYWINSFAGKNIFLDNLFIFITDPLFYIMIALFFCYFFRLIWKDKKIELKEFIWYFSGTFGSWFLVKAIKIIYPVERPFSALENVNYLIQENPLNSFPSGHATLAFALATTIFLYNKKIGIIFYMAAFLVAISRIWLGVHFPLDIFVGIILGIFIPLLFHKIFKNSDFLKK